MIVPAQKWILHLMALQGLVAKLEKATWQYEARSYAATLLLLSWHFYLLVLEASPLVNLTVYDADYSGSGCHLFGVVVCFIYSGWLPMSVWSGR